MPAPEKSPTQLLCQRPTMMRTESPSGSRGAGMTSRNHAGSVPTVTESISQSVKRGRAMTSLVALICSGVATNDSTVASLPYGDVRTLSPPETSGQSISRNCPLPPALLRVVVFITVGLSK